MKGLMSMTQTCTLFENAHLYETA